MIRRESGQVLPLLAVGLLVVMLGVAALVVDVGSWYLAERRAQAVADAAALAAAQELPSATVHAARRAAVEYAKANSGSLAGAPRFDAVGRHDDTISVAVRADAPTFFSRIFGIHSVTVHAEASARAMPLVVASRVIPIGVDAANGVLSCGEPCFGTTTTLEYDHAAFATPGAFGFLDLRNANGAAPEHELAGWLRSGYPDELPLGDYDSEPGNRFMSGPVRSEIDELAATHRTVLLPVFSSLTGNGSRAKYTVTGFAAFTIESWSPNGNRTTITGTFRSLVRHGVGAADQPYYGVKTVSLVK